MPHVLEKIHLWKELEQKEKTCLNQADDQLESSQLPVSVYISVMRSTDAVLICMRNTKHFSWTFSEKGTGIPNLLSNIHKYATLIFFWHHYRLL